MRTTRHLRSEHGVETRFFSLGVCHTAPAMSAQATRRRIDAGYEYTALELAEKDRVLKQSMRDNPNVPELWQAWLYDYIHKEVGVEEFERRVNEGYYDEKNVSPTTDGGEQHVRGAD